MDRNAPLPNFLIIGAQRSATRWLRINLGHHPQIFMCAQETGFFTDAENMELYNSTGLQEYRRYFEGWKDEPFVGEADPSYFLPEHGRNPAFRIHGNLPEVKLILLLRNPVDRYFSALYNKIKTGELPAGTDLNKLTAETIKQLGIFRDSAYDIVLGDYQHLFGNRLHIEFFDHVVSEPEQVYARVLGHLGADTSFVPESLAQPLFTSRRIAASVPAITEENRSNMYQIYASSVDNVETLLGYAVPDSWRRSE